jgi:GNAT superfamily N-acetyltransferase
MIAEHGAYALSYELARVDFARVTEWLSGSYWSPGIERTEVERGARHSSLVVGAYTASGEQVGYARVASDRTRVGFFMDVFVDTAHRKRGIGRAMVRFAMEHPEYRPVYIWLLATDDAHGVYAALGFAPHPHPERMMLLRKPWPRPIDPND